VHLSALDRFPDTQYAAGAHHGSAAAGIPPLSRANCRSPDAP